jgi:hypothetical protein
MVDFILSDDPRAEALRRVADFYVYPQSNPDGRWAGHARSNPENPDVDHNRYWHDPVGFTDLTVYTTAMKFDTNSDADYFIDFHSFNNPSQIAIWIYPWHTDSDFVLALLAREPLMGVLTATSPPDPPGVARHWAHSADGLNAEYTFTPECGFIPGWQPERWLELGENYALALYDALVLAGCDRVPTTGEVVFVDDFDDGTSVGNWDLFTTSSDYTAEFAFDYGAYGIPPAPNTIGATTIGVKFTVNNNDGVPESEALSAYPYGQSFAGDFVLKFDVWLNYNGGAGGGSGSTEFMSAGINQAGVQVNWPSNPASDGVSFAMSGEGGAAQDYRAYVGAAMFDAASGVYVAGSQNHTASFYQSLFPAPEYETVGAPGKHWVEVAILQHKGVVQWRLNDTLIANHSDPTFTDGNVMIGYMDVFPSIADPAADNFIVYDNVRVERLPETDCNGNTIADACETIFGGDFDANGVVDAGDFVALSECLGGPERAPTPAEPTCAPTYLAAFDFDGDTDVDQVDIAQFQTRFGQSP